MSRSTCRSIKVSLQEAEAKKEAELAKQMEAALEGDEDEEQRLIEERRRRRQQILAKHHQDKEFSGTAYPEMRLMLRLLTIKFGSGLLCPGSHACRTSANNEHAMWNLRSSACRASGSAHRQ